VVGCLRSRQTVDEISGRSLIRSIFEGSCITWKKLTKLNAKWSSFIKGIIDIISKKVWQFRPFPLKQAKRRWSLNDDDLLFWLNQKFFRLKKSFLRLLHCWNILRAGLVESLSLKNENFCWKQILSNSGFIFTPLGTCDSLHIRDRFNESLLHVSFSYLKGKYWSGNSAPIRFVLGLKDLVCHASQLDSKQSYCLSSLIKHLRLIFICSSTKLTWMILDICLLTSYRQFASKTNLWSFSPFINPPNWIDPTLVLITSKVLSCHNLFRSGVALLVLEVRLIQVRGCRQFGFFRSNGSKLKEDTRKLKKDWKLKAWTDATFSHCYVFRP